MADSLGRINPEIDVDASPMSSAGWGSLSPCWDEGGKAGMKVESPTASPNPTDEGYRYKYRWLPTESWHIWVSDIFHIVGRSNGTQQFALVDFTQLLDPRWKAPGDLITSFLVEVQEEEKLKSASVLNSIAQLMYNFVQRGASGAFGATIIYPIDLHG